MTCKRIFSLFKAVFSTTINRAIGIMWAASTIILLLINSVVAYIALIVLNVAFFAYIIYNIQCIREWEHAKQSILDEYYMAQLYQLALEYNVQIVYSAEGNLEIHGTPEDVENFRAAADISPDNPPHYE